MKHLFARYETPQNWVEIPEEILTTLYLAVLESGAKVVGQGDCIFEPQGYSAFILLSESHVSVHTWPENRSLFLDYFSCAENPDDAFKKFEAYLTQHTDWLQVKRRIIER